MPTFVVYLLCVSIWGSTWLAITYQLGPVPSEVSIAYRFLLGGAATLALCRLRGMPSGIPRAHHPMLLLQGVLMYGVGYIFVYRAEAFIVSGLAAVAFSLAPLSNMLLARLLYGVPMRRNVAVGGLIGLAGVTTVFFPEIRAASAGSRTLEGALLMVAALGLSSLASTLISRNPQRGLALWPAMGWGMLYGGGATLVMALLFGRDLAFDPSPGYVASLLYLAFAGGTVAFACYLTLVGRLGVARAGYVGVMVPIVALLLSALFEGFRWTPGTWAGIALCVAGNVYAMRLTAPPVPAAARA